MPRHSVVIVGGTTLPIRCAEILLEEGHAVRAMSTEDREVRRWAENASIHCVTRPAELPSILAGEQVDYLLSVNNLTVLPAATLSVARCGGVNFHDGPLPAYAGLNAPTWGIVKGETTWAISWHLMTSGVDEGPVLLEKQFEIDPGETSLTLNTKCYEAAISTFRELLQGLTDRSLELRRQEPSGRVYYARDARPAAACVLRWSRPAAELEALVRALDFGSYPNWLGLPKVLLEADAATVSSLELSSTSSGAAPGSVLAIDADSVLVASGTADALLKGLRDQDGSELSAAELFAKHGLGVGSCLPEPSPDDVERLTEMHETLAPHESFWAARLAELSPLRLPHARTGRVRGDVRSRQHAELDVPEEFRSWARELAPDAAPGDVLVAAVGAYLSRIGGQSTFDVAYTEPAMQVSGFAAALVAPAVPLHLEFEAQKSLADTIPEVLDELRKVRRRRGHLRDLVGRMHGPAGGAESLPVAIIKAGATDQTTPIASALMLTVDDRAGRIRWRYDPDALGSEVVAAMQRQLGAFLRALPKRADTPLVELPVLTGEELRQVLVAWNATSVEYPRGACVHELIENQVVRTPDRLAVICRERGLTYAELEARSNQLARHLRKVGVDRGCRVGICLDRSVEMVVGLIAILKAGGTYVPLDPTYPAARIRFMIDDCEPVAVLSSRAVAERLLAGVEGIVLLDEDEDEIAREPVERPVAAATADDPAYVIYTSGSTGQPKGVMVSHRNVVNFIYGMDACVKHDAPGTFLAVTSISFDISVLELFWTLARGFTVVVYTGDDREPLPQRRQSRPVDFSLFFFASDDREEVSDRYRLLFESAKYADSHGFSAVWTPERHFHAFGGLFPNPSVTSAALAVMTRNLQIRAGSVVSPLHNPIRIAEEWAFVDNLSGGRVGISFASGWQPDDFVFAPDNFADRKELMFRQIELVHRLWRGETVALPGPNGKEVRVKILPRPVQAELPTWITAAGSPETFELAGERGFGLLTHLLGQSVSELGEKIEVYRQARQEAGLDREGGHLTVMLHTFVGPDEDEVRERVREPMKAYLRSSVGLIQRAAWTFPTFKHATTGADGRFALDHLSEAELDEVLEFSFERYYETSGLLGTPEKCREIVEELRAIGVDEIACLIDFHHDTDAVLAHLPHLEAVRAATTGPPMGTDLSIHALVERYGVTHMQCTPSMASVLVQDEEGRRALRSLRQLLVGGEAFPPALAAKLQDLVHGEIVNMYGPTETTIWSSTYRLDGSAETVPIGRPIANTQLYILDEAKHPVPVGTPGELYIGGDGVALGYLNRPELTNERFVADTLSGVAGARLYRTGDLARYRPDGNVEFLGRADQMVKIRGYRIELGEVEAVLGSHPDVADAAVILVGEDGDGDKRLVAYLSGSNGRAPFMESLRSQLGERLPDFMVPSSFELLPALPRTPNGKLDRAALPAPGSSQATRDSQYVPPRDDLERKLVEIWERELGVRPIGIHENFFQIGGHSLLAVRVFAQVEEALEIRLPLATFFRAPTVAELADVLRLEADGNQVGRAEAWRALVEIQPAGSKPPLFFVHAHGGHVLFYTDLARYLGPDRPFYAFQAQGVDGVLEPLASFEEMAERYITELRSVQPEGPYRLGGDCLGGVVALEMAQQLRSQGEQVAAVVMLDSFHPHYRPYLPQALYQTIHHMRLIVFHLRYAAKLPWSGKLRYLRTKGVRAVAQVLSHLGAPLRRVFGDDEPTRDPLTRTQRALDCAFDAYVPAPYDGRVLVVRARHQPLGIRNDPLLGWGGLISQLDTTVLPTYFTCCALEPAVSQLAAELERYLAKVEVQAARDPGQHHRPVEAKGLQS